MPTRALIGALMILTGLGVLTPTVWMLFSPFLLHVAGDGGLMTWLTAALGGSALLVFGVRRLIPATVRS